MQEVFVMISIGSFWKRKLESLFDLSKDPGELKDISGQNKILSNQYLTDYLQWFQNCVENISLDRPVLLIRERRGTARL